MIRASTPGFAAFFGLLLALSIILGPVSACRPGGLPSSQSASPRLSGPSVMSLCPPWPHLLLV